MWEKIHGQKTRVIPRVEVLLQGSPLKGNEMDITLSLTLLKPGGSDHYPRVTSDPISWILSHPLVCIHCVGLSRHVLSVLANSGFSYRSI
jgi:hypothetical protein